MALHGLRSLRSVLQNHFRITRGIANRESRIGNRESGIGKLSGISQAFFSKVVINLEPSPPRTFSPSPFCNRCVWFKKRASALIKLYSQTYYFFKFLYYR